MKVQITLKKCETYVKGNFAGSVIFEVGSNAQMLKIKNFKPEEDERPIVFDNIKKSDTLIIHLYVSLHESSMSRIGTSNLKLLSLLSKPEIINQDIKLAIEREGKKEASLILSINFVGIVQDEKKSTKLKSYPNRDINFSIYKVLKSKHSLAGFKCINKTSMLDIEKNSKIYSETNIFDAPHKSDQSKQKDGPTHFKNATFSINSRTSLSVIKESDGIAQFLVDQESGLITR